MLSSYSSPLLSPWVPRGQALVAGPWYQHYQLPTTNSHLHRTAGRITIRGSSSRCPKPRFMIMGGVFTASLSRLVRSAPGLRGSRLNGIREYQAAPSFLVRAYVPRNPTAPRDCAVRALHLPGGLFTRQDEDLFYPSSTDSFFILCPDSHSFIRRLIRCAGLRQLRRKDTPPHHERGHRDRTLKLYGIRRSGKSSPAPLCPQRDETRRDETSSSRGRKRLSRRQPRQSAGILHVRSGQTLSQMPGNRCRLVSGRGPGAAGRTTGIPW